MGAHSNYISVESDFNTAIFIFISIIIGVILYYTFKIITCIIKRHYYKQFRTEQRRVEQYKKIKAQKERTYQNAINNFFCNRIDEDIDEMPINTLSDSSNKLIKLYKDYIINS